MAGNDQTGAPGAALGQQTQAKTQALVPAPAPFGPLPFLPPLAPPTPPASGLFPGPFTPLPPLSPLQPTLPLFGPMWPPFLPGPLLPPGLPGPVPGMSPGATPTQGPQPSTPDAVQGPPTPGAMTPGGPQPVEPEPDPKKISAAANNLFKAMDGWGTDETAVHNAMRGMSAKEIAALRAEYRDHYGRELGDDLRSEMSGKDLEEAEAMLSGDPVQSAVAQLDNAANGGLLGLGTDEGKIKDVLGKLPDAATRQKVAAEYEKKTGVKLDAMLQDELSSYDLDQSKALLDGDTTKAAAIKLDQAMNGGLFGWGTDEKGIYDTLAGCKSQAERDAVAAAYKQRTGEELNAAVGSELSGAEKDVATALMSGDEAAAAAAKIKVAAGGWGTDEQAIYKEFESITASEKDPVKAKAKRDALIASYNAKYGDPKTGGESFDSMLKSEFGGMDRDKAQMLARDGKLSDTFALKYAMHSGPFGGLGTDEALLRTTLEGKSKAEIDKIKADYQTAYGKPLDADLGDEVDGRDGFEIGQMLKGKPQSPQEMADRANEAWEFERGSGSNAFSNGVMDLFSNKGEMLDRQHARMQETFERAKTDGTIDPAEAKRIEKIFGWQGQDVKNYQEAKDTAANTTATVATIAAAAALTAATGGAGSPALVAALTQMGVGASVAGGLAVGGVTLASGLVGQGAKWAMLGDSYGAQDAQLDLGRNVINAVTAGVGKGLEPGISGFLGIAAKEKDKIPLSFMEGFQKSLLTDGFSNLSGAVVNTAFDEKAYQGDDFLGVLGKNLATAGLTTGVGAVGKGLSTPVSDLVGIPHAQPGQTVAGPTMLQSMAREGIIGSVTGAGLGMTNALMDPNSWNTGGDFFGNMLEKGGLGLLSGGLSKGAGGAIDPLMGNSQTNPYLWSLLRGGTRTAVEVSVANPFNPAHWDSAQAKLWLNTLLPGVLKGGTGEVNKAYGKSVSSAIAAGQTPAATPAPTAATPDPAPVAVPAPVSVPDRSVFPASPLADDQAVFDRLQK
jgi:hypothetical protein